jgi:hypothetical protein
VETHSSYFLPDNLKPHLECRKLPPFLNPSFGPIKRHIASLPGDRNKNHSFKTHFLVQVSSKENLAIKPNVKQPLGIWHWLCQGRLKQKGLGMNHRSQVIGITKELYSAAKYICCKLFLFLKGFDAVSKDSSVPVLISHCTALHCTALHIAILYCICFLLHQAAKYIQSINQLFSPLRN